VELERFQESLRTSLKSSSVIYMDKLELNIERLEDSGAKTNEMITLLLTANSDGTVPKFFVITPYDFSIKLPSNIHSVTTFKGKLNAYSLYQWFNVCLKSSFSHFKKLVVSQKYKMLSSNNFVEMAKENSIESLTFPEGSNCFLNPFRKITPEILKLFEGKQFDLPLQLAFDGIEESIKSLVKKYRDDFDIFKAL